MMRVENADASGGPLKLGNLKTQKVKLAAEMIEPHIVYDSEQSKFRYLSPDDFQPNSVKLEMQKENTITIPLNEFNFKGMEMNEKEVVIKYERK